MKFGKILIALMLIISILTLTACGTTGKNPPAGNDGPSGDNPGGDNSGGETPDNPDNPGGETPDNPDNPGGETPDNPDNLGGETPDNPDNSGGETPDNPDNPGGETPDNPDNPGGETPDNPDNPGGETPDNPDNPGGETPDNPGGDEGGDQPAVVNPATVYIVGDSTVCSFADAYYYPRYGYGTQLGGYLTDKATVVNLALSGRSSKSFITEANYTTLKNSLKAGDFLIIGFGHNDEKSEDEARFTDASLPYTTEGSFGYYLNEYYVKLAVEAGATPILCTPVVRAKSSNDYSGNEGHNTATGNYAQAIRDLGEALGVSVVDLTTITKAEYEAKGYEEARKYHAVTAGKLAADGTTVEPNWLSVDNTHLNIYGAKFVAFSLASELAKIDGIGAYVAADITAPTEADLIKNPSYVYTDYEAPDLSTYNPVSQFTTITDGWYGTAFGDTGGDPNSSSNGYVARETTAGVFEVGQTAGSNKGKFSASSDGFAFLFRQVEADKNFTLTVTATITTTASTKQAGFGLMLRDDVYLPVKDASITSNYLTAGILCDSATTTALFGRENATLAKGQSLSSALPTVGTVYTMSIERVGQSVTVTVTSGDKTVSTTHYDFDLFARDGAYMYVGMFANRGTVVEFTNVNFEITGTSQGA